MNRKNDFRVSARPHRTTRWLRSHLEPDAGGPTLKSQRYTHADKKTTHANKNRIERKMAEPCLGSPSIHTQQNWSKNVHHREIDRIAPPRSGSILYDHLVSVSKLFGSLKGPPALCAPVPARVLERERASVSCAMLSEAYRAKLQCRWHPPPSSAPLSAPPAAAGPPSPD